MQDSDIVELFFARSEQGITEMNAKYGRLCRQVAMNILANSEDAEEIVNAVYMSVWNAIPPARPQSLGGYLCAAVRNAALNAAAWAKRHTCDELYDELAEVIPAEKTVESEYESRQITVLLNEFLSGQSKKARSIFVARYYCNMSVKQIAQSVGMTETAVKTRLSRTRGALRKFLSERGVEV